MATAVAEKQEQLVEVEEDRPQEAVRAPVAADKAFRPYDPDQALLMVTGPRSSVHPE